MSEQAASYAVLGTDIDGIGAAVARHWGLDDGVLHLIRRLPLTTQPRSIDDDDDMLRAVASCAHEAIEATKLPELRRQHALRRVAQRYARALGINLDDLQDALRQAGRGERTTHQADVGELDVDSLPQDTAA
jgi:non-specific serine/threonine protein kinase